MLKELFDLNGKKILVTGASKGIGYAVALDLLKLGAEVYGFSRSEIKDQEILTFNNFHYIQGDMTSEEDRKKLLEKSPEFYDGVFLNAGASGSISPFHMVSENDLRNIFELNFFSPYLLLQDLYKNKKLKANSSIVLSSAIAAFVSTAATSPYSGSKGAVNAAFRGISADLARRKIRVNFVAFGYVDTDLLKANNVPEATKLFQPLGVPLPNEITGGVIYLLSYASKWLTGTTLVIDGGMSLRKIPFL
jgi:NAD(P)-dependent dehydrogenase (short-subunit alcohol dehydrogenase family)